MIVIESNAMLDDSKLREIFPMFHRVTLCGSTRFSREFKLWNSKLTLLGCLVYSVAIDVHSAESKITNEEKELLDLVHLRKIDNSDSIFVLDVNGYIGESTNNEILYAGQNKKNIYFLSDVLVFQ